MSFNYAKSRSTAEKLIAKFGTTGAIRRTTSTGPAYDPVQSSTDYPCKLVTLEYSDNRVDGTLILATDKMVYVSTAGLSIQPDVSDALVVGGVVYSIVNVKPLSPAGVAVMFEVQARL